MDCFHDFCLACDSQSNGPYCSQACRLADLERASNSAPTSPLSPSAPSESILSWRSSTSASAYVLSPAYNFSSKASESLAEEYRPRTSYFMRSPAQDLLDEAAAASQRSLTPSSSRSSLSSTSSNGAATASGGLSQKSRLELQAYFSSFTKAKAAKRRPSLI